MKTEKGDITMKTENGNVSPSIPEITVSALPGMLHFEIEGAGSVWLERTRFDELRAEMAQAEALADARQRVG